MQTMSAQALRGAVTGKAMNDAVFLTALKADPAGAITARFGQQPYAIRLVIEQPNELAILVPHRTEQLEKVIERVVTDIGDHTPNRGQFDAILLDRAWKDPAVLTALRANPHAVLDALLKEQGAPGGVPAGKTVNLYEEGEQECLIVIPSAAGQELTESELESVAGGETIAVGTLVAVEIGVGIAVTVGAEWFCS